MGWTAWGGGTKKNRIAKEYMQSEDNEYEQENLAQQGEPVLSVAWEEPNGDPFRWPTSLEDLLGGGAFRGDGQLLRLEVLQLPVLGFRAPRLLPLGSCLLPAGDFAPDLRLLDLLSRFAGRQSREPGTSLRGS